MVKYVITRLIAVIPVLFGVSIIIFLLVHLAPGDATVTLLGPMATEEAKETLRQALGLDQPLTTQYVKWLGHVLQGDFGTSIASSRAVSEMVLPRFVNTAILAFASLILALWIGFFVGMFAAARSFSIFDRASMSFTLLFGSTPPFWLGLILVLLFALNWRVFPATGMVDMRGDGGVLDVLHHLVLPAIATAAAPGAIIARALLLRPKLIIFDEPVSALDVSIRAQILQLLLELQQDYQLTYIFISHDLSVVKRVCDRTAVMYLGRIVELAESERLYDEPLHPYTQALLESIPSAEPTERHIAGQGAIEGDVPSPIDPPKGCHFHTRCPKRMPVCSEREPPLMDVGGNHRVACLLYE